MENIIKKIRVTRKNKGLSYENMAKELQISPSAYRKIEMNQSKLSVERLLKIGEILEIPINDLLSGNTSPVYNQNNNDNATFIGHQEFENYYQENKETTHKLVQALEKEIEHLKSEIEFLRDIAKS
ncbi:MAG: helix-turn-helix domain-containing protein [Flavobacteriaceae bacterium]|jgi:transcriptional regulator with XRE-family HTH domain|nr:helix-turn-helix domain-containing protein [Flavobacteriaceae bacterium]